MNKISVQTLMYYTHYDKRWVFLKTETNEVYIKRIDRVSLYNLLEDVNGTIATKILRSQDKKEYEKCREFIIEEIQRRKGEL